MSYIFAIENQKGGVGKTTTTVNLAAAIGEMGYKVLVVDMDSQGNATTHFGVDKNNVENTVYEMLREECTLAECMITDVSKNVNLIPANVNLAAVEIEFAEVEKSQYLLRKELDFIRDDFDYIIIDCPPAFNFLTINAMTAADGIIVPVQCEYLALEGLSQVINSINLVRERRNPDLEVSGIVFTMYDGRTVLSNDVVDNVKENVTFHVYDTKIPRNVRLSESPSYGAPITTYDPKSTGAEAYKDLAKEVVEQFPAKK